MSGERLAQAKLFVAVAAVTVALSGCGSTTTVLGSGPSHASPSASASVPTAALRVIKGWADALRAGRVTAAARYFRIPSVFFSGAGAPVLLRSLAQAESINAGLPCGAKFISARAIGRYVNVLFRLTNRPGPGGAGGCGTGTGETARTDFVIRAGRILVWLRAPDEPGDNGSPRAAPPTGPSAPGSGPSGSAPLV